MKMSDVIADFIGEMLSDNGGVAELQRKSLADRFSCVPSQINYVIETRFTPEHGYLVESQRGGGGYIRIVRLMDDKQRTLLEAARGIGGRLTQNDAARLTRALLSAELLTQREAQLLLSACSDGALAEVDKARRDRLRAAIFRCAVMGIATALRPLRGISSALDTKKVPVETFFDNPLSSARQTRPRRHGADSGIKPRQICGLINPNGCRRFD